jgi:hypothetical protein
MPLTRLLVLGMLVSCYAGPAFAQSQPQQNSNPIASQATSDNSVADQFRISPYPQLDLTYGANDPQDAIRADQSQPRHTWVFDYRISSQSGGFCYSIRSYRVVRDDPHSDSTHADGYTTCVPAARFRMYSTVERQSGTTAIQAP